MSLSRSFQRSSRGVWVSQDKDDGATLDDLREAVATLEDAGRIARRVLGGAHPLTVGNDDELRDAQATLRARETPSPGAA